jgi:hypothetical protein
VLALYDRHRPVQADLAKVNALIPPGRIRVERQIQAGIEDISGQMFEIYWRQRAKVVFRHRPHDLPCEQLAYRGTYTKTKLPFPRRSLSVEITHLTLAKVAPHATSVPAEFREIDDGISAFLSDHINGLRTMTTRHATSPGRFTDPEAGGLFRDLYSGPGDSFLEAADNLTKRLIGKMDARSASGLLVCLRANDGRERYGGVLKLQVVAPYAAVLEELASGGVRLSAVRDLLDKPGELQKGALSTSWLADDRIMIGDQLGQDAAYFPKAFSIQVYQRPTTAISDLFTAIETVAPNLTIPVAEALPAVPTGAADTVLAALEQQVPGLTPDIRAEIADALGRQARPVAIIDTAREAKETIVAGDIKITGPVRQMRQRVRIDEGEDATGAWQWVITVDSSIRPTRTHRS